MYLQNTHNKEETFMSSLANLHLQSNLRCLNT